jgi:phage baseplate assembly protein W
VRDKEIAFPLALDAQGRIATETSPDVRARQHLTSYIMTTPGERVMRPSFGTTVSNYVFGSLDPLQYSILSKQVADKVHADVRDVSLGPVTIVGDSDQATLRVKVEFALAVGTGQGVAQSTTLTLGGAA